jgi:hypothetical protein
MHDVEAYGGNRRIGPLILIHVKKPTHALLEKLHYFNTTVTVIQLHEQRESTHNNINTTAQSHMPAAGEHT